MENPKIAIIDADLIGRSRHRFPNLVCEKISAYFKARGADVTLKLDYNNLEDYDEVYISKVFTDTPFPKNIQPSQKIHLGGTGFFFDKAPDLPNEIEHHFPDYHLYDEWVQTQLDAGAPRAQFKEYLDYSIGFVTRGCFRKCGFCVNQKYSHVFCHSPLKEFYDPSRKKICLNNDNFLGYPGWKPILEELISTGKPFKFKQGLDERILTDEKCELLFKAKYDGDYTFAFDDIDDYELIEEKLKMIRRHTDTVRIKFYVLCGYKSTNESDIEDVFRRISLLWKYRCLPYIMRYQSEQDAPWKKSKHRGMYINLARWCNQAGFCRKTSFRQYCKLNGVGSAAYRYMTAFESEFPEIASKYFDLKWSDYE